jgi:hypothetical protein
MGMLGNDDQLDDLRKKQNEEQAKLDLETKRQKVSDQERQISLLKRLQSSGTGQTPMDPLNNSLKQRLGQ